jgi:hypothetical protein
MQWYNLSKKNKVIGALVLINLVITGYLGLRFFGWSDEYKKTINVYPTSLPWISNKSDCENRGRNWRQSKCWDLEHNMLF